MSTSGLRTKLDMVKKNHPCSMIVAFGWPADFSW